MTEATSPTGQTAEENNDDTDQLVAETDGDYLLRLSGGLSSLYPSDNPVRKALEELIIDVSAGKLRKKSAAQARVALERLGDPHSVAHELISRMLDHLKAG